MDKANLCQNTETIQNSKTKSDPVPKFELCLSVLKYSIVYLFVYEIHKNFKMAKIKVQCEYENMTEKNGKKDNKGKY